MSDSTPFQYLELSPERYQRIKDIFEDYAVRYRHHDDPVYREHMELKYEHIHRVCREMRGLGQSLGMNAGQLAFAESIALLHDIGRFEQFDKYATFADAESENHSGMAIRIIGELGLQTEISEQHILILYQAILNHNAAQIEDTDDPLVLFYSRLMRDADKLDIWRVTLEYSIFHTIHKEDFPAGYRIPEDLLDCFKQNRIIRLRQVDSYYDSILFRLSWIYDLNFTYTLEQFSDRKIATRLLSRIPASDQQKELGEIVEGYLERRLKQS